MTSQIIKEYLKALKELGIEVKDTITEEVIENKVIKSEEKQIEEAIKLTECFIMIMKDNYSKVELKRGLTGERLLKNIMKVKVEENEVTEFMKESTKEMEGNNISTIDLLYNYNGYAKTKINKTTFVEILKDSGIKLKTIKHNGRPMQCIINREWLPDFV